MKKPVKTILAITYIAGFLVSAGITAHLSIKADRNVFGEWLAPIRINLEIDRDYASNVSIYSPSASWRQTYQMFTRSANSFSSKLYEDNNRNVELYVQLDSDDFHRNIYLGFPRAAAAETCKAIDNMSVFIGNKLCYYSNADIQQFAVTEEAGNCLFLIPNLYYNESLFVKNWANYYGDFNLAIKAVLNFVLYPFRFAVSYIFLLALAFLYRKEIAAAYNGISKRPGFWTSAALMFAVILGFALRINGYVRHSGWSDEIYSAVRTGNPNFGILATFTDPGNPPFYFILLRYWFKIFGWSEEAGTMLSVILGTLAIPALFILIKENYDIRTALLASFFMALSGFAIGYSQEMRTYILKIFLAPLIALFFFRFIKNQTIVNLIPYVLLSVIIANAHYYGILYVMANFSFYCIYEAHNKTLVPKKLLLFLAGNLIAALSFMPYFLYQLVIGKLGFQADDLPGIEHIALMLIIMILAFYIYVFRRKISLKFLSSGQAAFFLYVLFIPAMIFSLSFFISFVRPIVSFRYLLPVSFPFFLAMCAILISLCGTNRKMRYLAIFLVWALLLALYEGKAGIPGGGYAFYREARAFIAADAAAHPDKKSCMLDNAPENAAYYGYDPLPKYLPDSDYDVLYVYNDIFSMNESDQRKMLWENNLFDNNILVIIPDDEVAIFKKYLR